MWLNWKEVVVEALELLRRIANALDSIADNYDKQTSTNKPFGGGD